MDSDAVPTNSINQGLPNDSTAGSTPNLTASPANVPAPQADPSSQGPAVPPITDAPASSQSLQNDGPKTDTATDISNLFRNIGSRPPPNSPPGASTGPPSSNSLLRTLRSQVDAFTNALLADFSSVPRSPVANGSQEKKATAPAGASCESGSERQEGDPPSGSSGNGEEPRSSK